MKTFTLAVGICVILALHYFGCQRPGNAEHNGMKETLSVIHSLLDSSSVYPDSAELYACVGFLFASIGDYQVATRSFERAIEADPYAKIYGEGLPHKQPVRYLLAIGLWKRGMISLAIEEMITVANLNPGYGRARYFLARMYSDAGDTANAIDHFKLARWMGETYPEERLQPISVEMQIGSAPCRMCRWDI
ncbi:MAG: tetratricopeptide repeat protein [Patescibacteria group bacterium]